MELIAVTADTAGRWQAVEAAVHDHDFLGLPADPVGETLGWLTAATWARRLMLLGVEDGVDVVAASADLPILENLDRAEVMVRVHPAARRRGLGRQAFAALVELCREDGRTRLLAQVPGRLEGGPTAAQRFAAGLCFVDKLAEVRRLLDTDAIPDLAPVEADARGHAEGYRLVSWADRAPAEHVPGLAAMAARMSTDTPQGDLVQEPEVWDADRWLANERDNRTKGRLRLGTMALLGDEVVAYTDFGINRVQPVVGYQWSTIVRADHRGHRLGMLVKAANLRQLRERSPETRWVNTWNAASNVHMIGINEALGWRPVDTWTEAQLDL